ncbi:MAG: hypothetical protein ACI4MP_04655 [Candidatus Ventricola sp.]
MNDLKSLDQLGPIAHEMLGGLHADERMRLAILRAAAERGAGKKRPMMRFVPAVCCAALALMCVGVTAARVGRNDPAANSAVLTAEPAVMAIDSIAAGDGGAAMSGGTLVADLGAGAMVRKAEAGGESLFAAGEGDIPLVTLNGAVYQMLSTPEDVGSALLGGQVGSVQRYDGQPSLAAADALNAGLSNVAGEGTPIYAIRGLAETTAVAAEVDGSMRVFQRVSYAGRGPGGLGLEDTFSVRGQVKRLELSGVGTLTGDAANAAIDVLLDHAVLKSADATARRQTLTVTLESGLRLQLGVSGDTLCGCGGWSCPEFFEAFEAAL